MYNKLNLSVGKVAIKSSIRPELGSIAFYGDRTVSTDSFRLLEVSAPGEPLKEPVMLSAKHLKCNLKVSPDQDLDLDEIIKRSGAKPIVESFPEYEKILKQAYKRKDDIKININGKFLAEMLTIMAGTNKFSQVEISIPQSPGQAIVLTAKTPTVKGSQQIVRGLVMPMNR